MAYPSYNLENSQIPASVLDDKYSQKSRIIPSSSSSLAPYHYQPLPHVITTTTKMPLPFTATTNSTTTIPLPTLSSSYSSTNSYLSTSPFSTAPSLSSSSSSSSSTSTSVSTSYFTWLVFLEERWTPFDTENQKKLEQTLSLGGTFVDITDSNFPDVKRVRVFPKTNYLSYLGVKYRLSRIMQPDAWLDHI